jgi:hypothetical protein
MDPTAIVNLSLLALNAVLNMISKIRSQSGLTDDAILAQAQKLVGANDTLYASLEASLKAAATPKMPPAP